MCSIMGYCGSGADFDKFKEGLLKTLSRGPDDMRIIDTGCGLLGFLRLSIMGLHPQGMQPFEMKGSYVVSIGLSRGTQQDPETLTWLHGVMDVEIVNTGYNSSYIEIPSDVIVNQYSPE